MYKKFSYPVVLGHNQDDTQENILSNIQKCQHYDNLLGMKYISIQNDVTIIRPLLDLSKSHIFKAADNLIHTKNSTPSWSVRGQSRNHVIPFLDKHKPGLIEGLEKLSSHLKDLHQLSDIVYNQWIASLNISESQFTIQYQVHINVDMWYRLMLHILRGSHIPSHRSVKALHERLLLGPCRFELSKYHVVHFNGQEVKIFQR